MAMVQRHQIWRQTRRIVPPMPKRNLSILLITQDMQDPYRRLRYSSFLRTTALWKTCTSVQVRDGDKSGRFKQESISPVCLRGKTGACGLVTLQRVARIERQFAVNTQHLHRTVDGIDVHQADGPGDGFDGPKQLFITVDDYHNFPRLI